MIINIENLRRKEIDKIDLNFCEEIDTISYCDEKYKLASPIEVEGKITRNGKGLYINANIKMSIMDRCSRCLDEVEVPLDFNIQGFIVQDKNYSEDEYEEFDAFVVEDLENVDLLNIISQNLDFNMPHKVLCDEDCKGLCHGCGANLNREDCRCSEKINDEDNIDPRFAKLKELLKNE